MSEKVTFLGLGVMGYPMAGHLAKAGHSVTVFNRTHAKAQRWIQEYGGQEAATPAEAAENSTFVFACVGRDDDVRQVTVGPEGAFHSMKSGAIFVDHTTASAQLARELGGLAEERGLAFLDAPVSGGQSGAENGTLTVMVGGATEPFNKTKPLMDAYARAVKRLGPLGSGQLTKMVNQICIAGLLQGLAEGLHFAKTAELDPRAVIEVISKGAAQSWQMENRYQTMLED